MPFLDSESGITMNPLPGITMRAVWGERMMMCFLDVFSPVREEYQGDPDAPR